MKLSAPLILLLAAFGAVEASSHDGFTRFARHNDIAAHLGIARRANGRCKIRPTSSLPAKPVATKKPIKLVEEDKDDGKKDETKTDGKKDETKTDSNSGGDKTFGHIDGTIRISDSSCGSPRASKKITSTQGPNGHIDWLNCGVEDGGWKPPMVTVDDIVVVDLDDALKDPNSPFQACKNYIGMFKKYANANGIPPIIAASIAMQESSCIPSTTGGGGEVGLMQITPDKCDGHPNCYDPDFNIKTGVAFFASRLQSNGGSLLKTIGNYNGWPVGMTVWSATKARDGKCCLCQNNLDYLHQMVNGWFQNRNPYSTHMGKFFNLDVCPGRN